MGVAIGAKPKPGKGLRIASGCSTLDEFTAVFRKFTTPDSIFIATHSPRPSGIEIRFAITLKDGKPVMCGAGRITSAFEDANNEFERPGMVIEFTKLDTMGRILLRELNAGSKSQPLPSKSKGKSKSENFEIPTLVQDPNSEMLKASRSSKELKAAVPESALEAPEDTSSSQPAEVEAPTSGSQPVVPQRAKGSDIILPANPFGELAATSLEAFVECTLYEETGDVDLANLTPNVEDTEATEDIEKAEAAPPDQPVLEAPPTESLESAPQYVPRPPKLPATSPPQRSLAEVPQVPASAALAGAPGASEDVAAIDTQPPAPANAIAPIALQPLAITPVPTLVGSADMAAPLAPARLTITSTQAIALAGICVVAGLGFGLLAKGGNEAKQAADGSPVDSSAAREAAELSGERRPAVDGTSSGIVIPAPKPVAAVATPPKPATNVPDDPDAQIEPEPEIDPEPEPIADVAQTPVALSGDCSLVVDVLPLDGILKVGETPLTPGAQEAAVLPCGTHAVSMVHPRYQSHSGELLLTPGEPTMLRLRLQRPNVALRVQSTPANATVTLNKRAVGKAPLKRMIPAFETMQVTVSSPGYQSFSKRLYPKKSETLNVRLRKNKSTTKPRGTSKSKSTSKTSSKTTATRKTTR